MDTGAAMKKLLLAGLLFLIPAAAFGECNGLFPPQTVCGNASETANGIPAAVPYTQLGVMGFTNSNTALQNWPVSTASIGIQVNRTGFYTSGDAPPLLFKLQAGNCAANSLVNDGGGCVDSATAGYSWVAAKTTVVDLREFGEVGDFGGNNTDNAPADAAGVAYACSLAEFSGPRVTVTDGGIPEGIASPIPFANCHGVKLDLNLHALPGSWTNGIPTTSTQTFYGPNQSNPVVTISGIWTPPSPWPSASITAITSNGGITELTLGSALTLTSGQRVLVQGSSGLANLNNTWVATVIDSTHITVPLTYASGGSGGTVWGPLPIGMIDVQSTSWDVHLGTSTIDCNQQAECVGVTNYGNLEAFSPLVDEGANIYGYTSSAGLFGFGAGSSTKAFGGFARQLGATQADRNGYGFYFAGGAADNYVQGVETPYNYAGVFCDYNSPDCDVRVGHTWSGNPPNSPAGGPFYQVCNTIFKSPGSFSSNTVDSGPVCIYTASNGGSPTVQVNGTFLEALGNSLYDAPIVYFAACSTPGCASLTINGNRLGIDPYQNAAYPVVHAIGSWQSYPAIALESAPSSGQPEGMINSAVWSAQSRDIAARLNNHTSSYSKPTSNITAQPSVTFTGTLESGSTTITGVTLFPQIGAAVSDSGGCITGSPILGWASFFNGSGTPAFPTPGGSMQLAGGATASGSCSNDTITVGDISWTGATVTLGSGFISGIDFNAPSLRPGVAISGTGIPAGSWVQGWDIAGQRLEFNNATGTGATASASESLTLTPSNYTLQPDDDGVAFVVPSGTPTFDLSPFVNAGWHAEVDILTGSASLTPLGSATLNNGTSSITLTQNQNLITAAGTFDAASNYLTSLLGLPQVGGQLTGAAFPTLSGAGLAVGNGTPPILSTNGQATVSALAGNGIVLGGKGSINDVEIANASKQAAITIPTGTTNVKLPALSTNGIVTVSGTQLNSEVEVTTAQGGLGADNSSASGIPIFASGVVSMAALNAGGGIPQINGTPTIGNCLKWSATGVQDAGAAACPAGGFTVATLPAGTIGEKAYVTDATSCTFLGALTGGGSAFCPVIYNGSAWVGG